LAPTRRSKTKRRSTRRNSVDLNSASAHHPKRANPQSPKARRLCTWRTSGTRLEHTPGTRLEHAWNTPGTHLKHGAGAIGAPSTGPKLIPQPRPPEQRLSERLQVLEVAVHVVQLPEPPHLPRARRRKGAREKDDEARQKGKEIASAEPEALCIASRAPQGRLKNDLLPTTEARLRQGKSAMQWAG